MDTEQQVRSNRLWIALLGLDLQLYKGSIYKQRWGTPGGNDQALLCYDEALRLLSGTDWPSELQADADELARRITTFRETLVARDATSASSGHTRMMLAFEAIREDVRHWPAPRPATAAGAGSSREPTTIHAGMEAPGG